MERKTWQELKNIYQLTLPMLRRTGILFITVMFIRMTAGAQIATDTLHLTLDSAESLFLHQNLSLLAQKYNVDAQ